MIENDKQLEISRRKLGELETLYTERRNAPVDNVAVREESLRSLKRLINQLKEEIVRYESTQKSVKTVG